jgi:hypothetical protein
MDAAGRILARLPRSQHRPRILCKQPHGMKCLCAGCATAADKAGECLEYDALLWVQDNCFCGRNAAAVGVKQVDVVQEPAFTRLPLCGCRLPTRNNGRQQCRRVKCHLPKRVPGRLETCAASTSQRSRGVGFAVSATPRG